LNATSIILGAGFSHAAGLPLARDLLNARCVPTSDRAGRRFMRVSQEWKAWRDANHGKGPEQFLGDIQGTTLFPLAVEMIATTLAMPVEDDLGQLGYRDLRYSRNILRPSRSSVHQAFWSAILSSFLVSAVITTNYDLLIERSLRHKPMRGSHSPGFFYGGFRRPQVLKGQGLFSVRRRWASLEGSLPLYKLHGSLNWGTESSILTFFQDMRPAFRNGGDAQIVPPVVEKDAPSWLRPVWDGAFEYLKGSRTWIVCGYSLPPYDKAINEIFSQAANGGDLSDIYVLDPFSKDKSVVKKRTPKPRRRRTKR
jgi:hypothetical protein